MDSFVLPEWWEKNKVQVSLGLAGFLLLFFGSLASIFLVSKRESSAIEIIPVEEEQSKDIFVHLAGAVEKPGLYQLSADARVNDLLIAGGGLSVDADRTWFEQSVNLAQKLSDGVKLYIPFQGEKELGIGVGEGEKGLVSGETNLVLGENQGRININIAGLSELENLSGIGSVYSQRIVDYREEHGSFSSVEEIMEVEGIGQAVFDKIKDEISVF